MIFLPSHMRVFLAPGATDMRKAINSLSILVESTLRLDLFSGHLFVFCNQVERSSKSCTGIETGFAFGKKGLRSTGSNGRRIEPK